MVKSFIIALLKMSKNKWQFCLFLDEFVQIDLEGISCSLTKWSHTQTVSWRLGQVPYLHKKKNAEEKTEPLTTLDFQYRGPHFMWLWCPTTRTDRQTDVQTDKVKYQFFQVMASREDRSSVRDDNDTQIFSVRWKGCMQLIQHIQWKSVPEKKFITVSTSENHLN